MANKIFETRRWKIDLIGESQLLQKKTWILWYSGGNFILLNLMRVFWKFKYWYIERDQQG
jgi:hypothetical protein